MRNIIILLVFLKFNCVAQINWTPSNIGLPTNAVVNAFTQSSIGDIYIALNSNGQGQLYKSNNSGSSWTQVPTTGLPTGGWANSLFTKGSTMFLGVGLDSLLYSSTDNGQNWFVTNNGLPSNSFVNDFALTSNGDIYIVLNSNGQGQLYKSTNNGALWTQINTSGLPSGAWANSLFIKDNIMFLGLGNLGSILYSSTDNGQNWYATNNGLPSNSYVNDFAKTSNGDIYIILNSNFQGQLYKSTNNGALWSPVTTSGLPSGGWAGSLFIKGNSMFIGTGGIDSNLYTSNIEITGIDDCNFSNTITLFPNPSSGQINISSSNKIDQVKITNILGEVIYNQKNISYQVSIPVDKPGLYFVSFTNGDITATKKIIISK